VTSVDDARSRGGCGNCDRQSVLRMEAATAMPCHFVVACCHILGTFCTSLTLLSLASSDLAKSFELRKGLDVNIASAMASEPSDRTKILNSIRLPRAGTVFLEQEARDAHESNLIDLWSSFPSDFLSPRAESTLSLWVMMCPKCFQFRSVLVGCETFSKLSR
jgi:hypothetical protein